MAKHLIRMQILNGFKKYCPEKSSDITKSLFLSVADFKKAIQHMSTSNQPVYTIPAHLRKMENMHIAFWLLKDISWCMIWKELGIIMIVPTLSVAIWIAWKNRQIKSELAHNMAIVFWITANAYWMISEFTGIDSINVWRNFNGKHMALIPFITGAVILLYYYAVQRPREIKNRQVVTM
jgi:hypothetical protein